MNELDDLTSANAKAIKDVDARAQEGIRHASAKADQADRDAMEAGTAPNRPTRLPCRPAIV